MLSREIVTYESSEHVADVCTLMGPNHRTQALAREMQKRGEILCTGAVRHFLGGVVAVEYIRLRPESAIRRRILLRTLALGVSATAFLAAVGVAAWGARYALLSLGGLVLFAVSLRYLATRGRHRGACLGLHCPGCHS